MGELVWGAGLAVGVLCNRKNSLTGGEVGSLTNILAWALQGVSLPGGAGLGKLGKTRSSSS